MIKPILLILIAVIVIYYFIYLNEKFTLRSYPCLSRQIKLLKRVTELLWYNPNSVTYQKLQWILQHNNLSTNQLDDVEKQLPS
jgi:hypothetical protein